MHVTIYSTREQGYRRHGIHFGKKPRSFLISDAEGDDGRSITHAQLDDIRAQIARAKKYSIEPPLWIHDHELEESEAERALEAHRAEMANLRRMQVEQETRLEQLRAEREAAETAVAEKERELSEMRDKLGAAAEELKSTEAALGTVEQLSKEVARLEQESRAKRRKK